MIYEINITYKCNWGCSYCSMKDRLFKPIDEDKIISLISSLPDGSYLTLSGGEPGLCRKEYILKLLSIARKKSLRLSLNTNGTFIKRYNEFLNEFEKINLHLDISKSYTIEKNKKINYVVILTSSNLNDILNFVKQYDVKFDIIPSTHYDQRITDDTVSNFPISVLENYMTPRSIFYAKTNLRYNVEYLN